MKFGLRIGRLWGIFIRIKMQLTKEQKIDAAEKHGWEREVHYTDVHWHHKDGGLVRNWEDLPDCPLWTKDEIRIKIAEYLGWTKIYLYEDKYGDILTGKPPADWPKRHPYDKTVPGFPWSLDAMFWAEEKLTKEQCKKFHDHLREGVESPQDAKCNAQRWTWHSTAHQRAYAFVLTIS